MSLGACGGVGGGSESEVLSLCLHYYYLHVVHLKLRQKMKIKETLSKIDSLETSKKGLFLKVEVPAQQSSQRKGRNKRKQYPT